MPSNRICSCVATASYASRPTRSATMSFSPSAADEQERGMNQAGVFAGITKGYRHALILRMHEPS